QAAVGPGSLEGFCRRMRGRLRMSFFPRDQAAPAASSGPVIEWEEPRCLLCGGGNCSLLVEAPDTTAGGTRLWFSVGQCQQCGLCFTSPRPSPESIAQFYPQEYRPHRTPTARLSESSGHKRKRKIHARREHRILSWRGRGRLLDFGCGGGSFLMRM